MADRHIPFLGFAGGGRGDYEHSFELRTHNVPVQSRHFAPDTYRTARLPRQRQGSLRDVERSQRWHSRLSRDTAQEESDLSSTMSSTAAGSVQWTPRHSITGEVDNMAYVHPSEWSDDRLTLYPQLSSTPLNRAGPQTPCLGSAGAAATVGGRSQYPLPSCDVTGRGGTLRASTLLVNGYGGGRPPPEQVYQHPTPSRPRERSLDHGTLYRGERGGPAAALALSRAGAATASSCESSYVSNDSFESRPGTAAATLISKRGIPSISSGIPTMGTSTINGGRYLPTVGPAGRPHYLPPAAGKNAHYMPAVTGGDKLAHGGCGKEVAFRLKQTPLAAACRRLVDRGCGRRRSALLLCLLLFCIGLLIGAISVVLYLTVTRDLRSGAAGAPDSEEEAMKTFRGQFTVTNRFFEEDYSDPSSDSFRRLATKLATELNALFRASNVSTTYNSSVVVSLRRAPPPEGSTQNATRVEVLVHLNQPSPNAVNTIGTAFIEGMRNAYRRMWLGRFNVDLDDISFAVSSMTVPTLPPATTPPLPIDVRWGSWEQWSPCVPCNTNYTQTRQRKCLLNNGAGVLLDPRNIRPCLWLNQGADIEHRSCVCETRTEAPPPAPPPAPLPSDLPQPAPAPIPSRRCDQCEAGEVCVQRSGQAVPVCQTPKDADDPLGCGGLCKLVVEQCRKISDHAYQCLDDSLCQEDEFRCLYGPCLKKHMLCDGHANCSDWDLSDELDCECSGPDHFQCGNKTSCLPVALRCNGVANCWDGSDEVGCQP